MFRKRGILQWGDTMENEKYYPRIIDAKIEEYLKIFGASLYHYQDYQEREIDAVIQMPDGTWGAFEIKLGANQIDAAAKGLLSLKESFEKDPKGKPPKFLCVICGMSNAAYQRADGVYVIPITALKN